MLKLSPTSLVALVLLAFPILCSAATFDVSVVDNRFTPNDITIKVGDTVRWTNAAGGNAHDVTADDFSFASVTAPSFTFSRTFNSVEEILYHCTVHSSPGKDRNTRMNGRVVVENDQAPPVAGFTSSCTGLDCKFTDQSTDSDGSITSWSWDFGDGVMSSTQNPDHAYGAAGTYVVSLEVTDNDGQGDSTVKNVTVANIFLINTAISDAWFFPGTDGQGFFIIIWEGSKFVFLSWFTYDTERPAEDIIAMLGEPGHRWLTAQGPFDGDTAVLDVFVSSGGTFDSADPEVITVQDGTITITWTGCNSAIVTYNIPSLNLMGEIPIQRIVLDNVAACQAAQP